MYPSCRHPARRCVGSRNQRTAGQSRRLASLAWPVKRRETPINTTTSPVASTPSLFIDGFYSPAQPEDVHPQRSRRRGGFGSSCLCPRFLRALHGPRLVPVRCQPGRGGRAVRRLLCLCHQPQRERCGPGLGEGEHRVPVQSGGEVPERRKVLRYLLQHGHPPGPGQRRRLQAAAEPVHEPGLPLQVRRQVLPQHLQRGLDHQHVLEPLLPEPEQEAQRGLLRARLRRHHRLLRQRRQLVELLGQDGGRPVHLGDGVAGGRGRGRSGARQQDSRGGRRPPEVVHGRALVAAVQALEQQRPAGAPVPARARHAAAAHGADPGHADQGRVRRDDDVERRGREPLHRHAAQAGRRRLLGLRQQRGLPAHGVAAAGQVLQRGLQGGRNGVGHAARQRRHRDGRPVAPRLPPGLGLHLRPLGPPGQLGLDPRHGQLGRRHARRRRRRPRPGLQRRPQDRQPPPQPRP